MENRPASWNGVEVSYGESVSELARRIDGPAPERWAALVALAHTPGAAALAVLEERAGSPEAHVRRCVAEAIGVHAEGYRLRAVVCSLLFDRDPIVVRSACEAAARLRLLEAHDSVARLLEGDDPSTRTVAVRVLRVLWRAEDSGPVLALSASDPSQNVRREAAWTLRANADRTIWRTLFERWQGDPLPRHRQWACELACEFGGRELLPPLEALAVDRDGHVRHQAARAVQEIEARSATGR